MGNKIDTSHADISKISQCITEEGLGNLEEKLKELNRQWIEIRLGEFTSRLEELSEKDCHSTQ
jgi:hypothetical protein